MIDLLRLARPKQWTKNLLIFAAPAAGGVLFTNAAVLVAGFAVFCIAASGIYFVNDAADASGDLLSARRASRPVAAGRVPVRWALGVGAGLMAAALLAAAALGPAFAAAVGAYLLLGCLYTAGLRRVAVLDMGAVAGGFVMRGVAGGVLVEISLSPWFLVVALFGSLFLVAGKRYADLIAGDSQPAALRGRPAYTVSYLRYVWTTTSAIAVAGYCLWSIESPTAGSLLHQLSVVPFTLGILRYALLVEGGQGGAPEDLLLGDRPLQLLGLAWAFVLLAAIYR